MDTVSYALSRKYVQDTANSLGAVKGSPCRITGIQAAPGGNNVTFSWVGTDGTTQSQTMFVADGVQGEKGENGISPTLSISSSNGTHVITITDVNGTSSFTVKDGETPEIDSTLTVSGQAADAKAVGDAIAKTEETVENSFFKKNQGSGNQGKLLYIGADGSVLPLILGSGLEIINGVLRVTNSGTQSTAAICGNILCGEAICGEV